MTDSLLHQVLASIQHTLENISIPLQAPQAMPHLDPEAPTSVGLQHHDIPAFLSSLELPATIQSQLSSLLTTQVRDFQEAVEQVQLKLLLDLSMSSMSSTLEPLPMLINSRCAMFHNNAVTSTLE